MQNSGINLQYTVSSKGRRDGRGKPDCSLHRPQSLDKSGEGTKERRFYP